MALRSANQRISESGVSGSAGQRIGGSVCAHWGAQSCTRRSVNTKFTEPICTFRTICNRTKRLFYCIFGLFVSAIQDIILLLSTNFWGYYRQQTAITRPITRHNAQYIKLLTQYATIHAAGNGFCRDFLDNTIYHCTFVRANAKSWLRRGYRRTMQNRLAQ